MTVTAITHPRKKTDIYIKDTIDKMGNVLVRKVRCLKHVGNGV